MRPISKSLQPVPMPEADRGEELSIAYVSAIAAHYRNSLSVKSVFTPAAARLPAAAAMIN